MKRSLATGVGLRPVAAIHDGRLPTPFALSLSKGHADLIEAFVPHAMGFDRLSQNGDKTGLRYLSPNGSLRTVKFACGSQTDIQWD